jgi:hypothetical protein
MKMNEMKYKQDTKISGKYPLTIASYLLLVNVHIGI